MQQDNKQEEKTSTEEGKSHSSFRAFWIFVRRTLSLREGVDKEATVEGILHDVEFRGASAWILVCSILIACVGLSENNIPIIVGAMLISPLMGPILGIGLAAGTNDNELLKKSLINQGVAIVISLVISALYFFITPVATITPELFSRKDATIMATVVAFLGGSAGIIAGSRSLKNNVVPGVAIATALMPPLCAAGFGLGTMHFEFFFGAMYLFFINSVFIAVPTYLYIKFIGFPIKEFVDPKKERKIKNYIFIFILITVIPSAFIFYSVINEGMFSRDAKSFITHLENDLVGSGSFIVDQQYQFNDEEQIIKIALMGKTVSNLKIDDWKNELHEFDLEEVDLQIVQNEDYNLALSDLEKRSKEQSRQLIEGLILNNEKNIETLEKKLRDMEENDSNKKLISFELQILFPEIESMTWMEKMEEDSLYSQNTIPILNIHWNETYDEKRIALSNQHIEQWLRTRMNTEELIVTSINPIEVSE